MPKEIIDSRYFGQDVKDLNTGELVSVEATYAHVGWNKDAEHVELAVLNPTVKAETPNDPSGGWFVQLDRAGINRLIRVLRTARDQAFGRDE